jgi:outer membrane protein TolC
MRFILDKLPVLALATTLACANLCASGYAQSSISSNSGNSNGGASGNSGGSSGGNSQGSPYPGWAPQAGPIADIPFSKTSAGVSFDSSQYQGSVLSAPATSEVLNLSLDDAIHRGLDYNLALQVRHQQQQIARGQRSLALQPLLPVLTLSASTALTEINLVTEGFKPATFAALLPPGETIPSIITYQNSSGQMNLQWSVLNYGAFKQYQAAKIAETYSASDTADSQQTVILNVAKAYLQVLAAYAKVQDAQSLLKADQGSLNDAVLEHQAGTAANLDELRARVQFQSQQQTVIADQNDFAKKNIALERMIGLDPAQQINLTEIVPYAELDAQPTMQSGKTLMLEAAWNHRADLASAQQQVHAAELQRDAARAERYPTITFGGYYGVIGITYGSYHGNFVAQAQLKFPIFQEAKLRGDRQVAEEQINIGRSQVDNLKQQIDADLRNAYLDYNSAKSLVAVSRSNVDLAKTELEQSVERYRAGVSENLSVTDAESVLADAQNTVVNSMYQYNLAKLELARALGILDKQYREYLSGK